MIPNAQEEEGDKNDNGDGPEVDQLSAKHCRITVCQHNEVIALNVTKSQDNICESHESVSDVAIHRNSLTTATEEIKSSRLSHISSRRATSSGASP